MKRIICAILCITTVFALGSCSNKATTGNAGTASNSPFPETIINAAEYTLYQNLYYVDDTDVSAYLNKDVTKEGIFTTLNDKYSDVTRYYVWGYYDQTLCCDWQWEFIPKDINSLPPVGSTVKVSGVFKENPDALDSYEIENADVTVEKEYKPRDIDIDATMMNGTLERVQVFNLQNYAEDFEGKTVSVYGRIMANGVVQHPYYDECFSVAFDPADEELPIGTNVIVTGTFTNGGISGATVTKY
ncbi:MAG: hypothetical protein K6F64_01235 [Clostridia bacterium]|nr:hypothetical protein [Clostridia bacterium]